MKFLLIGTVLITLNSLGSIKIEAPEPKIVYINPTTGKLTEMTELIEAPPIRNVDTIFPAYSLLEETLQYQNTKIKRVFDTKTLSWIYESDVSPELKEINE